MSRTHGQAVFFAAAAGDVAFDGHGNGVFTKAVIEGLQCRAAKSTGTVTPYTLGTYVQNSVVKWIRRHIDRSVHSAIQLNIDGDARNMPISQCWPAGCSDPARCLMSSVAIRGTTVIARNSGGTELWRRDLRERVRKAVIEETDGGNEVVVATRSALCAFDGDGKQIWETRERKPLRDVAIGDLFRDHRREAVTLWGDDAPRLAIDSAEGERLAYFDFTEPLDHVAIGRPTKHYAPRIVVSGKTRVMVFDPKKVSRGKPLWSGTITPGDQVVEGVEIVDRNGDGKDDISIKTANGTLLLDFKGKVIAKHAKRGSLQFHLLHSHRKRP